MCLSVLGNKIEHKIEQVVAAEGLVFLGHVALSPEPQYSHFQAWLRKNFHAQMKYMERDADKRAFPQSVDSRFHSAICVALRYGRGDRLRSHTPRVAQYARVRDYHRLLKEKAKSIASRLALHKYRLMVDTAPILERALAVRGGQGFVGKNTCFISVKHGSYLLLAEIFSDIQVSDKKVAAVDSNVRGEQGGCGGCRRCQVHCPTGALDKAYQLDANKCLSYQTIENRGEIPKEYWVHLQNYYYGCDICQIVCPYNRRKPVSSEKELAMPTLMQVATMTQKKYERYFGGTAMTRAKRGGLMRNALIALHAINHPQLPTIVAELASRDDLPNGFGVLETIASIRRELPV